MLHIFGEVLMLLAGQGHVKARREAPEGRRGWSRPRETPRLR